MAAKTANVMARVEPDVKEQAEQIMAQLGIPASVVINMLYKQIIMTQSIPFSLSVAHRTIFRDQMTDKEFDESLSNALNEGMNHEGRPVEQVFSELKQGI